MIKQCTSIIIVSAKILCIKSPNKLPYNFTVLRTTLCTVTSVTVNLNWNIIYEHLITTVVILFTPKKRRHYKTGMRSKVPYAHMVFFSMQPPLQILSIFLSQLPKIRHWIVYYCFCACICTYMFLLWLWFLFCVLTFTNCIHFPSHFQQLQSFVFIPDFFSKNAVYFNTSKKYYHCHLNHKCFLSARGAHQLLVYIYIYTLIDPHTYMETKLVYRWRQWKHHQNIIFLVIACNGTAYSTAWPATARVTSSDAKTSHQDGLWGS
jgi:hypothetical protein